MLKKTTQFNLGVLFLGWLFVLFFWEVKAPGLPLFLFILSLVGIGLWLAKIEDAWPHRDSLLLLPVIIFFGAMTAIRWEPLSRAYSLLAALGLLIIFARTMRSGKWLQYGFLDYFLAQVEVGISALFEPLVSRANKAAPVSNPGEGEADSAPAGESKTAKWRRAFPVLRGVFLAVPVLIFFGALLSQADPIFNDQLQNLLKAFDLEKLGEYFRQLVLLLVVAYLASGVLLFAFFKSEKENVLNAREKPLVPSFMGFIESGIVLGAVNLLFLAFVIVQFRYFFGGEANINAAGYTYAEYARRGFGELVAVAFFSLLMFMALSTVTRRVGTRQKQVFSGLGIALVILVGVMLFSAFQRLLLYEAAYGFTRMRMYPHIFMIWLGILLVFLVALELIGKERRFALACVAALVGFGATLALVNVDGVIARQNLLRVQAGERLDTPYLLELSTDAVPVLVKAFDDPRLSDEIHNEVGLVLACKREELAGETDWRAAHYSDWRARQLLAERAEALAGFSRVPGLEEWDLQVLVNGKARPCWETSAQD